MSSKPKKVPATKPKRQTGKAAPAKTKEAAPAPPKAVEAPRPKGPAPLAMVSSRHEGTMIERQARGFSAGELGGAGFSVHEAGRMGLAVDIRRRTVLESNVQSLKSWFIPPVHVQRKEPEVAKVMAETEEKPKKRVQVKKQNK